MDVNISDVCELVCDCGSEEICICYSAPVFVYLNKKEISKVVVQRTTPLHQVSSS